MARARNIKPAFFLNDDLAENNCALGRLLFIGLWTLADYKGDLEWRAGRIKTQVLPYDDCDIKKLAINLDKSGFVRFYSDGEKIYLNITNFVKHQNPHKNERDSGSDIPEYSNEMRQVVDFNTLTINRDKSGLIRNNDGSNPADSLIPLTDSLTPHILDSDESKNVKKQKSPKSEVLDFSSWPQQPSKPVLDAWLAMRRKVKASCSQLAMNTIGNELHNAVRLGLSVDYCLSVAESSGWKGFKTEWVSNGQQQMQRPLQITNFSNQNYQDMDLNDFNSQAKR